MKPRPELTHHNLTPEDFEIWLAVQRAAYPIMLWVHSEILDRRDADLMLWAQELRHAGCHWTYLTAKCIGGRWCGVAWYYKETEYVCVGGKKSNITSCV